MGHKSKKKNTNGSSSKSKIVDGAATIVALPAVKDAATSSSDIVKNPEGVNGGKEGASNPNSSLANDDVQNAENRVGIAGLVPAPLSSNPKVLNAAQSPPGLNLGSQDSNSTASIEKRIENVKVDLLICCGDFQAVRNEGDLQSMAAPPRYRSMNSFWKYYFGEKVAPFPTIFIGGNHEASNYLWELYYGGWAAPQIYFLGFAGVVKFGNIRIGGLSGIYKKHDYRSGHYEKFPYDDRDIKSVYHIREYDVHKLMQIEEPIDIFLSHDWPSGITDHGDLDNLLHRKGFLERDIMDGTLGSKPAAELLGKLRPNYWFSAHLHCKFSALVQHGENGPVTKFLALDKCHPRGDFLQIVDIECEPGPLEIQYDEEWLAITKKFNSSLPRTKWSAGNSNVPVDIQECRQFVKTKLQTRGANPFGFVSTVPFHDPSRPGAHVSVSGHCRNPQTEALLNFLELEYLLDNTSEPSISKGSPASFISREMGEGEAGETKTESSDDES